MDTMTLEEIQDANPNLNGAALDRLRDRLSKSPRRKKRGYNLALPGNDPMRFRGRRWRSKYGGWYGTYD